MLPDDRKRKKKKLAILSSIASQVKWQRVLAIAPAVALLLIVLRGFGLFQLLELSALDVCFSLRPLQAKDDRIIIVGINESDLKTIGQWPIPDRVLAQVLEKVKQQQPKAIGLDIYRDLPVGEGHEELARIFNTTPNLIGIQKIVDNDKNGEIAPPPELEKLGQASANDFPWDVDGKTRRAFLYLDDSEGNIAYSLGFRLALIYLGSEGITPRMKNETEIELGKTTFSPFSRNDGGYVGAADQGYQILLNYRGSNDSFQTVSLTDVLLDRLEPRLMENRIVLIGSTAKSIKDFLLTPYSSSLMGIPEPMTGVEVHANSTSQIVSAALEERSLLKTWKEPVEWLWILTWSFVGAAVVSIERMQNDRAKISFPQTAARVSLASVCLIASAGRAFLLSWWIPIVPPLMALGSSAIATIGYTLWENLTLSHKQLEEYSRTLELKVEKRTEQLQEKNQQIEQALQKLKAAQKQIVAQEKLASLGSLTAGIAHEIRNPLNFVNNFAAVSVDMTEELLEEIASVSENLEVETADFINETLTELKESVDDIKKNGERIEAIVQGMLMLARNERGKVGLTDLNNLLEEAVALAYHGQQAKDEEFQVRLETDYDPSIGEIYIVSQDISQALVNIINNACDALKAKQKAVGKTFKPILQVKTLNQNDSTPNANALTRKAEGDAGSASPDGAASPTVGAREKVGVEIRIRDNGEGIPEDILAKIFNPFFTTKPPGEGTGLGLAIAYDIIVGQHQGDVKIETEPGAGAEFIVFLPKNAISN
ncbi:MAG: CHASE2 domain-containing protein [Oscillatoria sp. SIO1A7]|nr:CHASE2 domain-containing protein [Oscillatoria sp. SIO1A7]